MSRAIRRERRRRLLTTRSPRLLAALLMLWTLQCGFPNYELAVAPVAGAAGSGTAGGGTGGGGAQAGTPIAGSNPGGTGGDHAAGGAAGAVDAAGAGGSAEGGAPECPGEQWPIERCPAGCLTRYPDHCYDGVSGDGEIAVDCGAECQPCTLGACVEATDCLSGECAGSGDGTLCEAPLRLGYQASEQSAIVGTTAWTMFLTNSESSGGRSFNLRDLEVRYYLDRNAVTEPILLRATQSNLHQASGESLELKQTSWLVERLEDGDVAYNAYVSLKFGDPGQLAAGDYVRLYQQMTTGDPGSSTFDQRANYSFVATPDDQPIESLRISVFHRGELVWGLEPRPSRPRACFVRGINLNGPELADVSGHDWQSSQQAGLTTTGSAATLSGPPHPAASGALATTLATATRLQAGQSLALPTDNGQYLVYLYAVSAGNDGQVGVLTVQGKEYENSSRYRGQMVDGGYAWARLGPYRVDVTADKLEVAVSSGALHFSGIELWYPE